MQPFLPAGLKRNDIGGFKIGRGTLAIEHKCRGVRFALHRVNRSHFDANLRWIHEIGKPIEITV